LETVLVGIGNYKDKRVTGVGLRQNGGNGLYELQRTDQ